MKLPGICNTKVSHCYYGYLIAYFFIHHSSFPTAPWYISMDQPLLLGFGSDLSAFNTFLSGECHLSNIRSSRFYCFMSQGILFSHSFFHDFLTEMTSSACLDRPHFVSFLVFLVFSPDVTQQLLITLSARIDFYLYTNHLLRYRIYFDPLFNLWLPYRTCFIWTDSMCRFPHLHFHFDNIPPFQHVVFLLTFMFTFI